MDYRLLWPILAVAVILVLAWKATIWINERQRRDPREKD